MRRKQNYEVLKISGKWQHAEMHRWLKLLPLKIVCDKKCVHTVVLLNDVVLVQKYVYDLLLHRTRTFERC